MDQVFSSTNAHNWGQLKFLEILAISVEYVYIYSMYLGKKIQYKIKQKH